MRRFFLRTLATWIFRRAWLVLPLLVASAVLASLPLGNMAFDTSLASFLPPVSPETQQVREIQDYRRLEPILVVIHARETGQRRDLVRIADALAPVLSHPRYVSAVVYKVDELAQSYYESLSDLRLMALLTTDDWAMLQRMMTARISEGRLRELRAQRISAFLPRPMAADLARDPLGALDAVRRRLATSRGPTRLEVTDGYFMTPDGRTLVILVYPFNPPENGRDTLRTLDHLEASRRYLLDRNPTWAQIVDIEFLGSHATTALHLKRMEDDLALIAWIAVPLLFLSILLVFRKGEAIVFILAPPALGAVWTLGLATVVFGGITWVTAAVLLVIVGIGLLYSTHLFHRFTVELYRHHNYYRALAQSYVETGRGVLVSAAVVALLFFLLFIGALRQVREWGSLAGVLRDASGFGQLGIVAGAGILANLAACLLTLPALAWVKHRLARGRVKPVALYRFRLERISELVIANPRATLAIVLLASVILGYHARGLDFNPRFASILPFFDSAGRMVGGGAAGATAAGGIEPPGRPVIAIVRGATLQEALVRNDRLYDNLHAAGPEFDILSFDSLRTVLPSLRSQQASIAELVNLDLEPIRRAIESACRAAGFRPVVCEPFFATLRALQQDAARVNYVEFSSAESDAFIATVQRYVVHKENSPYYIATPIYPHAAGFAPGRLAALERALGGGIDGLALVGDPLVEQRLSQLVKYNLALLILASIAVVAAALLLHFRSPRLAGLTFVPVACEILWLCGGLGLAGIRFHFFTLLVTPMLLSLAMDNALQLTQYYYDRRPCTVRHAVTSVGRAAVLTCLMVALIYGTMVLLEFPGVKDLGGAVLIGALAVLAGTLLLQPALLQLFGRGQPIAGILSVDQEPEA